TYKTKGTCSREIQIELDGDTIREVTFIGGCDGNAKGLGSILKGMKVDDVIERLQGIECGPRPTSCPDQLATALTEISRQEAPDK
ncbi:MAG: TIGR03905 family TSCPD domain-containing protein, partial [Clostridiales bacterium]|nr:TIGR03905 family TSCPD domain-containing protein [Clostridiales bacterium]